MIPLFRLEIWDPEDLSTAVDGVAAHDELINAVSGSLEGGRIATGSRDGRVSSEIILMSPDLGSILSLSWSFDTLQGVPEQTFFHNTTLHPNHPLKICGI